MSTVAEPAIPKQREHVTNAGWRVSNANMALSFFAPDTVILSEKRPITISWTVGRNVIFRRWQARSGQDFYPVWSHRWPHGGTACIALSQLVRWIQGRPVLPLSSWRHWAGPKCELARAHGNQLIERLVHAEYPEHAQCVLCGAVLNGLDWWNLHGVSGPCCSWTTGCRQRPSS
jgi:hypothetical protein